MTILGDHPLAHAPAAESLGDHLLGWHKSTPDEKDWSLDEYVQRIRDAADADPAVRAARAWNDSLLDSDQVAEALGAAFPAPQGSGSFPAVTLEQAEIEAVAGARNAADGPQDLQALLDDAIGGHRPRMQAWMRGITDAVIAAQPQPAPTPDPSPTPDPTPPAPTPDPTPTPAPAVTDRRWPNDELRDQGQTGHCFPAGTLVRMADGSAKPIDMVQLLDRVVTAEGRTGEVEQVMVRTHVGDLVTVRLRGHSGVRCTPEHPFLTRRGYVPACQLQIGDEVALTRTKVDSHAVLIVEEIVSKREYANRGPLSRVSHVGGVATRIDAPPETLMLDAAFGRLLGLYAAEGHASEHTVKWSYGAHEAETLVPETVALIEQVLGAEARIQPRLNNVINVVLGGKHWALLFKRLLGEGAHAKRLHPALAGDETFRQALLFGWIDGDGHRRRNSTEGVTVSKALALDMHAIANDLGLRPTFNEREPSMNRHAASRRTRYVIEWGSDLAADRQSKIDGGATWRKVRAIEVQDDFIGHVYNLEVEGDHSYVADGIGVHNCVGFSGIDWGNTVATDNVDDHWPNDEGHKLYYECKVKDGEPEQENGSTVRSLMKVLQDRARLANYASARSLQAIVDFVLNLGPVCVGTNWYEGMFTPDADGIIHLDGTVKGGHAWLLVGYGTRANLLARLGLTGISASGEGDDTPHFLMLNSWGDWGPLHGYALIAATDVERLVFAEDGEAWAAVEAPLAA